MTCVCKIDIESLMELGSGSEMRRRSVSRIHHPVTERGVGRVYIN